MHRGFDMFGIRLRKNGWVLVADGEKALFLRNGGNPDNPQLEVLREIRQENPPTSRQGTARPGRLSDGAGNPHRSAVQETDWHRLEKHEFARGIANLIARHAQAGEFDQVVIVAPPVVLGQLRKEFNPVVSERILAEINKDLTKHPVAEIQKLLFE
jgi:protein required for attachment to host cells